jgi:DNA/RNA-binding domain of Phe-tRNA-synthetase-like protein
MKDFSFNVNPEVLNLGVKIVTARISGVQNSKNNAEFEKYKIEELEKIKETFKGKKYNDDHILAGFRDLHTKVGRSNRKFVASPEDLRYVLLEKNKFPHVNTLVDIYNLVSIKSGLALGAHSIDAINGNVTLRLTKGDEAFIPLGKKEPELIFPGEYAYIDDKNNIICRLEVLQIEATKITEDTHDVFMIIEGNANTTDDYVKKYAKEVCELITTYCGGKYTFLN